MRPPSAYRQDGWFPQLWHRGPWDAWMGSGRRTPLDLAHERVREYLKDPLEPVLDDAHLTDVRRVVREAEIALLGRSMNLGLPL